MNPKIFGHARGLNYGHPIYAHPESFGKFHGRRNGDSTLGLRVCT